MLGEQRIILECLDYNVTQLVNQPAGNEFFSQPLVVAIQQNFGVDVHTYNFELEDGTDLRINHGYTPNNPNLLATRIAGKMLTRRQLAGYCGAEAQTRRAAGNVNPRPPIPNYVIVMIKSKSYLFKYSLCSVRFFPGENEL